MNATTTQKAVKLRPASFESAWVIEKDEGAGAGWEFLMMEEYENRFAAGYLTLEQANADIESITEQLRAAGIEVEILPTRV